MDLLWIIDNQISKNPRNEHLKGNLQIDSSNELQILQFKYQWKAKNQRNLKRLKWLNSDLYLKVVDPESQYSNSDEKWTVLGQTLN